MSFSIPAEYNAFVDELVATEGYSTPEAVVAEALRRWREDRARFAELKASLDEAVAELDRGEGTPLDFEEIKRKGRELLASQRPG
jgi:Arc/MetJ-type ribon-helix-helix transcriptional regulator